jgi:hypothetical protein
MGAGGDENSIETGELNPSLKYDLGGPEPIVLIPQPSDDPNDPLVCRMLRFLVLRYRSADGNVLLELAVVGERSHHGYSVSGFCENSPQT